MTPHERFEVSAKAALFSEDLRAVIVMEYLPAKGYTGFGLPGGHLEPDEHPDDAIIRELDEELGLEVPRLEQAGFYRHRSGKMILGYTGLVGVDIHAPLAESDEEIGIWMSKQEFSVLAIDASYRQLVEHSWRLHHNRRV